MTEGIHQLTVGNIKCVVVNEGISEQTVERLAGIFTTAPEDALAQGLAERGAVGGSMNPLYIEADGRKILVDVGFGNIILKLATIGVTPDDMTDVLITHFHGDHVMGLIDSDGNPHYPNATVIVNEAEWNHWMSESNLQAIGEERANRLKACFTPYTDKITRVKPNDEIVAGVKVVEAYGHTPGHIGLLIESNGERLLHLVDTAHITLQDANPDWSPLFDTQPDVSPITRRRWFAYAADEGILTLWYHFPFPGLGHISRDGEVFKWTPLTE